MSDWNHKDEWRKRGEGFLVTVSHLTENLREWDGPHRWCVYAYIYPRHRLFGSFNPEGHMWDQPVNDFHGGCTFFKVHREGDKITSFQVGGDYSHDGDSYYCDLATMEEACSVFNDAERLFDSLSAETA